MANDRYRQQTSLSFSPEMVSLLDDLRDETGINRSQLVEKAVWYAVKACFLDYLKGGVTHAEQRQPGQAPLL